MTDWASLVERALRELNGDSVCVPGAKLHTRVRHLGAPEDFVQYLQSLGKSFRQFLEGIRDEKALDIHVLGATDMLVGFRGASLPEQEKRPPLPRFRADIYEAFTRISPGHYRYVEAEDVFKFSPDGIEGSIDVPPITLGRLIERRSDYVDQIEDPATREYLAEALRFSANPLADFYRRLVERRLVASWHQHNYQVLQTEIKEWASDNKLEPREEWFVQRPTQVPEAVESPQSILAELAQHMEDDEIRTLPIPFRAVEQLYWALRRGRKGA